MGGFRLPVLPKVVRASDLIGGEDSDFIINAYIALQNHWPDEGGFAHYVDFLARNPAQRLKVLQDLAASRPALRAGVQLIQDLPEDYDASGHARSANAANLGIELRIAQAVNDAQMMRQAASNLTREGLSDAVRSIVETQKAHITVLESRLNEVSGTVQVLAQAVRSRHDLVPPESPSGAQGRSELQASWLSIELRRLSERVLVLERQRASLDQMRAMQDEIVEIEKAVDSLRQFATVELKRQVADYVNAMVEIARAAPAGAQAAPREAIVSYG